MPRWLTHGPTLSRPPASRHWWVQPRQQSGVTCHAWANASRSTVAAASPRPREIAGGRAEDPAGRGPPGWAGAATGSPPLVGLARRHWAGAGTRPDRRRNGASRSRLAQTRDDPRISRRPAAGGAPALLP